MKKFLLVVAFASINPSCTNQDSFLESDSLDEEIIVEESPDDGNSSDDDDQDNRSSIQGELKAFPSAYGAGAFASGGRGGRVLYVTTTEDTGQQGSLRWAISQRFPRTVVFAVGGEFNLTRGELRLSSANQGNLTIAGQTAPGDGVTITGNFMILSKVDNIIIRYLRFRGVESIESSSDLITGVECTNIIIDHCSGSWATDEIFSFTSSRSGGFTGNITLQRSLFAEAIPTHSTSSIFGGNGLEYQTNTGDFSWNANYVYNISHRFPNVQGRGRFEVKNNIIYNWKNRIIRASLGSEVNQQNNYYKAGPATEARLGGFGRNNERLFSILNKVVNNTELPDIYVSGNLVLPDAITDASQDNFVMWRWFFNTEGRPRGEVVFRELELLSEPQPLGASFPMLSARDAFDNILADVGANKSLNEDGTYEINLDDLDRKYINAAINDTGLRSYRSPDQWILPSFNNPNNNNPYLDADRDGMPDAWEIDNNLNPDDPSDGNLDNDNDGYTNLEEFLNAVDL